jgi:hypothetical protein
MKRKTAALTVILVFLFPVLIGATLIESVKANGVPLTYLPEITINSNGTITPSTSFINRTGFIYTLTANVNEYVIVIKRSNIILDGAGYIINASNGDNDGLRLIDVVGVTVKNLEVIGRYTSVYLYYSSHCLLTGIKTKNRVYLTDGSNYNTIANSTIRSLSIGLGNSNKNLFIKNNVETLWVSGSNNQFYLNNFFLNDTSGILNDNFWDNGSVGNYWSNYLVKYPNASEIGNTGIGDTAYVMKREQHLSLGDLNATNIDNYPLMYPYDIEKDAIAFPTPEPTPTPEPEPFPTTLVTASVITIAVTGMGLIIYFKKRKH